MQNKKAISLIVLVITIIVMIILASAIIISLSNTNIFNKAEEAVDKYTDVQLKQEVEIIFANAQLEKYMNNNYSIENELKKLFENKYGKDNVTVNKSGKNYKVEIEGSKTVIRVKADGSIEEYEEMEPTNVYARLDDEGTLYLRATEKEGYNFYESSYSIQSNWNTVGDATQASVNKVIIEEKIAPVSLSSMFSGLKNLSEIQNIENLHTENVTNMYAAFFGCSTLTAIDVSNFDTTKTKIMTIMFEGCNNLINLNISNFDTTNVTKMYEMFSGCSSLINLDVSGFNTSNVIDMTRMFNGCTALKDIDVSNFDTSKATSLDCMFGSCSSLTSLDVTNFNTAKANNVAYLFFGCSGLTKLNLASFDVSNATRIDYMFYGCTGLTDIDISNFDTSKVKRINRMFEGCANLKKLKLGNKFVINEGAVCDNMLDNVPSDIKITATEDTRDKMISVSTLTNSNFEIIN